MCYNCGCQKPDDDMGRGKISQNGESLTDDDFQYLADKWGMKIEASKKNTYELLKKQYEK